MGLTMVFDVISNDSKLIWIVAGLIATVLCILVVKFGHVILKKTVTDRLDFKQFCDIKLLDFKIIDWKKYSKQAIIAISGGAVREI